MGLRPKNLSVGSTERFFVARSTTKLLLRNMRGLAGRLLLCTNEFPGAGVEELKSETTSPALEGVGVSFSAQGVVLSLGLREVDLAVFHEAVVEACELVCGGSGGFSCSVTSFHLPVVAAESRIGLVKGLGGDSEGHRGAVVDAAGASRANTSAGLSGEAAPIRWTG